MEWHKSIYNISNYAKENGLVLYGAGFWGQLALKIFQLLGVSNIKFADDNVEKQRLVKISNIEIYSLEKTVEIMSKAAYIICIDESREVRDGNCSIRKKMLDQLVKYNVYSKHSEIHMQFYTFLLELNTNPLKIQNADYIHEDRIKTEQLNKIVLFNNMSNSGAYYCEQLFDGHPEMVFLPYVESLEKVYLKRLQHLKGQELLIEIMAQLNGYFINDLNYIKIIGQQKFHGYCLDKNGKYEQRVYINVNVFLTYLVLAFYENNNSEIRLKSYAHMLKIIFAAYSNSLRKKNCKSEYWIFYHMHLPAFEVSEIYSTLNQNEFKRIENLIIIREPIQHLYSWIKRFVLQQRKVSVATGIYFEKVLKSDLGIMLEKKKDYENVKVVRFEDLKYNNIETLENLCKWLKIEWNEILTKTTLNGIEIYFPVTIGDKNEYITGNDTRTVGQVSYSTVMTEEDIKRLEIIFSKFRKAYDYATEEYDFNGIDIDEFLLYNFRYCDLINQLIDETGYPVNNENRPQMQSRKIFNEYMRNYRVDTEYYECI